MISGTYYTQTEVAAMLGKHRRTIARWMAAGKIQYERVGNMVLIEEGEVARLQGGIETSAVPYGSLPSGLTILDVLD